MNCKVNTQKIETITLLILALSMCITLGVATALTLSDTSAPPTQSNPSIEQAAPAHVWTDKADYHPGELVTIYGSGFSANTPVAFVVTKLKDSTQTKWSTQSDEAGNLTTTYQIDPEGAPLYKIDATDGENNASYTFKDGTYSFTVTDTTTGSGVSSTPLGHITMHPGDTISATGTIDGPYQYGYEVTFNSGTYVHNPGNLIASHYNNPLMINPLIFTGKTWQVPPTMPLGSYRISAWGFNSNPADPDIELCHILVEIVSGSTAIPTKLVISGPSSLTAETVGSYTIKLKDRSDNSATLLYDLNVDLSASSGTWYSDAGCTSAITSISIASGSSLSASIYYKHATVATVSIGAQADAMVADSRSVLVSGLSVSQPITVTMANGAQPATVTINGGNPSPSSFAADGTQHTITMDSEASFMLSFDNRGSTTSRNGFIVNSAFSEISSMFTASTSAISANAYQQFKITPYYTVTSGSPSTYFNNAVSYTSLGISKTTTPIQGSSGGSDIWVDYSTAITYKSPILESTASKRWIIASDDTTTNTMLASVTSSRTITANYYYQYKATFRYTTQDYIAIPAGNHIGSYLNCNSTLYVDSGNNYGATSATLVWHDYSSPTNVWFQSYTASGNERWSPSPVDGYYETGTITNDYTHQYKVTFTASGGNILTDSTGTIVTVEGAAKTRTDLPFTTDWITSGTSLSWQYSSPVTGSTNYLWASTSGLGCVRQSGSLTVASAGTVTGNYITRISQPITVTMANGAPSETVTITTGGHPSSFTFPADGTPHIITMDSDASFSLSFQNYGSTRNGFSVIGAFSATTSSYTASTTAITLTAYRQFQITPYYTVVEGSPSITDAVGYTSVGAAKTATPTLGSSGGSAIWADHGTAITYKSPITGAPSERWIISSSDTAKYTVLDEVSSSQTVTANYYHQYVFTLRFLCFSGWPASAVQPSITAKLCGLDCVQAFTTTATGYWVDAGSWSVTDVLGCSTSTERWATSQAAIGTLTAPTYTQFNYNHQYNVTFTASTNILTDGSGTTITLNSVAETAKTLPISRWYDSGSTVNWAYSSPVTGESHNYYWSSTDGLASGQSGTLTVNNYGTVTGNYEVGTATSLNVSCFGSTADRGTTIIISGTLTSGSSGISGKTITLSYFKDGSWTSIEPATTESDGSYSYAWTIPSTLVNGEYPLKADFAGDSTYEASSAVTGTVGNGNLFVVPEVGGALGALLSCIGGASVFTKLRSKRGGKA